MGLKMSPGSVITQLDVQNAGMNQVIDNAERVLSEISALEESADRLQGKSYDSIREYYTTLHVAVMHQTILFAEAVIQKKNTYKACISGELGGIGCKECESGIFQAAGFLCIYLRRSGL